jgi:hypothetical protein
MHKPVKDRFKREPRFEDDKLTCERLPALLTYIQEQDRVITHLVRENLRLRQDLIVERDRNNG